MEVGFIIPAYSEARLLPKTLAAIGQEIRRSKVSAEVIVVDNGSCDDTAAVARSFDGVKVVTELQRGLANARAAGLSVATGGLIAQVDADTVLPYGWLDRVLQEFLQNPSLVGLSGPYIYYDISRFHQTLTAAYYRMGWSISMLSWLVRRPIWMMQGGNLVVRREILEAVGGYNLRFQFYGEDTDLACRLASKGLVHFSFKLAAPSSGRRLRNEGIIKTGLRYAANFICAALLKRPFTLTWKDVR